MHGVGPSTVLGGRYAVQRRLAQMPRAERWSAHDTTLERDVVVVCFGEHEPHSAATLDAARRAAGLDNHRLVRVLDVGRSEGVAFFVEEAIHDAQTLTQILGQGGLPAEEVRRITGEAATGLEAARGRGLHHLRLTPDSVLRAHDGTIKVRGVATSAALTSEDDVDPTRAARLDAVGLVAVTYAALTSRWPLPGAVTGLESAPHVVGGVPAPSEIAAGVPGDLDALCRLTLNEDEGPLTPGDYATQIAPWAVAQVAGLSGRAPFAADDSVSRTIALPVRDLPRAAPVDPADQPTTESLAPLSPAGSVPGTAAAGTTTGSAPGTAVAGSKTGSAPGTVAAGTTAVTGGVEPTGRIDSADDAAAPGVPAPPLDHDSAAQAPARFNPPQAHPGVDVDPAPDTRGDANRPGGIPGSPTGTEDPSHHDTERDLPAGSGAGAAAAASAAAAAGAVGSALGTAGQAAGQAAGAAAQRFGTFARATADKAAERKAQRQAAEERAEQRRISLNQALVEGEEPLDPPLPMLPQQTAHAPTRDQSKIVLAIMATFLVVVTVLGFWGASRIGSQTDLGFGEAPPPRTTVTVTGPAATVTPSTTPETPVETPVEPKSFAILSATGYDPEGDGAERNGETARVFDGKGDTSWSSEGYATANLGGLKKGVGVRLDLGQKQSISQVTVTLPNASDVTVYAGQDSSLDQASEIGSSTDKTGAVTLKAKQPVDGQYVFIWFTKVSQVSDGRFRATLAEVTVG